MNRDIYELYYFFLRLGFRCKVVGDILYTCDDTYGWYRTVDDWLKRYTVNRE